MQSPNEFFQMPFMSAITREISRYFLVAAGKQAEADALVWQPRLGPFPHPQLSAGTAGYILPPFIFVACMFATISHLTMLVTEKETGLRQALQTMGLQQGSYWLSWWLFEAVMAGITAWCITGFGEQHAMACRKLGFTVCRRRFTCSLQKWCPQQSRSLVVPLP